jgi:hypothetical protein
MNSWYFALRVEACFNPTQATKIEFSERLSTVFIRETLNISRDVRVSTYLRHYAAPYGIGYAGEWC